MSNIKFWIIRDRRESQENVIKDVVEGNTHSIYFNSDAAESAKYSTETVWEIQVNAVALDAVVKP